MIIRKNTVLIFLIFNLFSLALFGEIEITSPTECINKMIIAAKNHWETPLRAVYKEERIFFYPVSVIKEHLADGRVKIFLKNASCKQIDPLTKSVIKEEIPELILPLNKEYGLPYKTELAEVDHYLFKGKYYIEKKFPNENINSIYIYDGIDTRKITSPFKDRPAEKWVEIYKDTEHYLFGKTILFIPYPYYEITPQFTTSPILSRENNYYILKIDSQQEDITFQVSFEENFMRRKVIAFHNGNKTIEMKVSKVLRLNNLYLPVEIECKSYNADGSPKIFARFVDITWEVKTIEDVEKKINMPNPENSKVMYPQIQKIPK